MEAQQQEPSPGPRRRQGDLLGRRTSQTDPDTGSSSSTYDNAGQLLTTT
ncbi:hypothetical protein, partial [Streptomyces sp. NPDC001307]